MWICFLAHQEIYSAQHGHVTQHLTNPMGNYELSVQFYTKTNCSRLEIILVRKTRILIQAYIDTHVVSRIYLNPPLEIWDTTIITVGGCDLNIFASIVYIYIYIHFSRALAINAYATTSPHLWIGWFILSHCIVVPYFTLGLVVMLPWPHSNSLSIFRAQHSVDAGSGFACGKRYTEVGVSCGEVNCDLFVCCVSVLTLGFFHHLDPM